MTKRRLVFYLLPFGLALSFAGILLAQNAENDQKPQDPQNTDNAQNPPDTQNTQNAQNSPGRPLIVNGKQAGTVVQMDGRSYVDVETLAQATNGSVTIEPNRVVLNLPPAESGGQPGTQQNQTQQPSQQPGLSREFAREAIAVLAGMREWRGAIGTILMYNAPVVGAWPDDYRARVRLSLDQLKVSVITDDDNNTMDLLENNFDNISGWADNVVSTRQNLNATNTVRPSALQDDPQLGKITACGRFLSSMLVSGSFSGDPSCH